MGAARRHEPERGLDTGTHELRAAAGKAARGRGDQGVGGGLETGHMVDERQGRGAHRR